MGKRNYRSLGERFRLHEEVLRLRETGLGYKQISKILEDRYNVSLNSGMICNWVKGRHHPLGKCNKVVEDSELAYVIGGWLGDGSLNEDDSDYKYCIRLRCEDYDFAKE